MIINKFTYDLGDVVQLNSGGPEMTVVARDGRRGARCAWVGENGQLRYDSFPDACLKLSGRPINERP